MAKIRLLLYTIILRMEQLMGGWVLALLSLYAIIIVNGVLVNGVLVINQ